MKEFLIKYKLIIGGVTAGICTIALLTAVFLPYFVNVSAPIIDEGKNIEESFESSPELISVLKVETGTILPSYSMYFNDKGTIVDEYEMKYYDGDTEVALSDIAVTISGVNYLKGTGTYRVELVGTKETLKTNLQVNDTQKPTVVLKTISTPYATEYNPKDFVNQYDDNSREYSYTVNIKDETKKVIKEAGQHSVLIEVCDTSNNCTEQRGTIIVGDKSSALVGTEEKKIVIKSEEIKYGVKKTSFVMAKFNVFVDGSTEELSRGTDQVEIDQSGYNGTVKSMNEEMLENYDSYVNARTTILNKTNEYRKAKGLEALVLDESLSKVAMLRAMEIAYSGNATHTRPNGSEWTTMWTEYGAKEQYTRMAENIAGEYETDLEACEGWHNSKSHNAIMLEPTFKKIGIGKYSFNGKTYWVQHFA